MLGYYLDLALRSFKQNTVLTGLMIVAASVGIVFAVPFAAGAAWSRGDDDHHGNVVVLGENRPSIQSFHLENLLIAGVGAAIGLGTGRMSWIYIGVGALIVLLLCQLVVLWPAYRAASIAPSLATRGL